AKGTFRVMGSYTIQRGEYSISIQNLVSKKFKIESGSTISFNGDVAMTTANIQAVYKVRAPLSDLFGDTSLNSRYRRPVALDCKVVMTGNLVAPNIKFEINAPSADNETREMLRAQLNTEDNMAMQFLSLLLMERFMPQQEMGSLGSSLGGATLGGLLTMNVSRLISQLVGGDLSVSLTPATSSFFNDVDVGASYNGTITDRILFSVSVEQQSNRKLVNPNSSNVVGDVDVEFLLDKSGKLRLRAFSHSNDQYTEMVAGSNRFGVGVVYQEDFDSFADLWKAMLKTGNKKK
ncbi:MAG: translocation/assembly module TamB domain-containing protein, partial [Prevotellaceae bacterium]|nr:translocation/assembly module TamB domain-containing protein [Prevotellaceae bacterium]